jgi:hypothetical protein
MEYIGVYCCPMHKRLVFSVQIEPHFASIFQFSAQLYSYYQLTLQFYDSKSSIFA